METTTEKQQAAKLERFYRRGWLAALAIFVFTGATGAFMRFGLIYGFPWELQFANIRHAHSHTMYFGWVTPALMALIASQLPAVTGRTLSRRFRLPVIISLVAGLLAYLPFLLYGYRSAEINGANIPFSVIAAGFNIVGWYIFIYLYWRETRGLPRNYPLQLWDGALIFLVFASLGGWGLAISTRVGFQDIFWSLAFTHIFLDTFAYGWFMLALLGLAYAAHPTLAGSSLARSSINLVIIGLPVIFLLGMPLHVVPPLVRWVGALGGLLVALGLLGHIAALWPLVGRVWRWPLIFLGLTAVAILVTLIPGAAHWVTTNGLRVPFLHWQLLGFMTLGLVTAAQEKWGRESIPGRRWMTAAVLLLVLSLLPLSGLWPVALRGEWTRHFAAWAALGPALVGLGMLIAAARS